MPSILWVDDQIDLLEPHILFLESKGYTVTKVTNGADAVARVQDERFDLVFLDEQMPGMDGIETLGEIKRETPDVPVVMITKSEEEEIMEDAIGGQISDYLIKPVHPKQLLLTCKRILDRKRIRDEHVSQDYLRSFREIGMQLSGRLDWQDWIEVYRRLIGFDRELEGDDSLRQVLENQLGEANQEFARYIEDEYSGWIGMTDGAGERRPVLSHEIFDQFVIPTLRGTDKPVYFFLIDCMRLDQWLEFQQLLFPLFEIETDTHFSLLPTATPYSRNAIFSGMLPAQIAQRWPKFWAEAEGDEHSRNRHEEEFLRDLLRRRHVDGRMQYEKITKTDDGRNLAQQISNYQQNRLSAIVVNFVDNLAHSRSDSAVLKEIAPDERAYRALTRTWFEHSWLYQVFQDLARTDCHIVITADHGVIRSLRPTKVIGDRETSTSLRYKFGRNLKCDGRHAILVKDPH
ncbi:MAG: bifunctional response regulator/alkaline phosphatase family protein, partial [Bacteroidota bacterium]